MNIEDESWPGRALGRPKKRTDVYQAITLVMNSRSIRNTAAAENTRPCAPIARAVQSDTEPKGILKLPEELLSNILGYILTKQHQPIKLRSSKGRRAENEVQRLTATWTQEQYYYQRMTGTDLPENRGQSKRSELIGIFRVCRRFYFSAIAAFYGTNTLWFRSPAHLDAFLQKVDIHRRRCIKWVMIDAHWEVKQREEKNFWDAGRFELVPDSNIDLTSDPFEMIPNLKRVVIRMYWPSGVHEFFIGAQHKERLRAEAVQRMQEAYQGAQQVLSFDHRYIGTA